MPKLKLIICTRIASVGLVVMINSISKCCKLAQKENKSKPDLAGEGDSLGIVQETEI